MDSDITPIVTRDGHGTHSQGGGSGQTPPLPPPLPGDPTFQLVATTGCILPALDHATAKLVAVIQLEHARDQAARTATAYGQILDVIHCDDTR